ncbi:MAG: flavin reductase [Clostridiales bacterium]|nr:flavin reductase [Clostridiales bacterium]
MNINILNDLSYGMYIISTKYMNKNVGCFVNTVSQITSENPIISVSINKSNYTNEALNIGNKFAISILSEKTDSQLIGKFGFFSSKDTDKFDGIEYSEICGIPVVTNNICGYLICEVINIIDCETHNIVLARVIDGEKLTDNIPMTYKYYHEVIKGKVPKTAPTYKKEKVEVKNMGKYVCKICGYVYDNSKEEIKFEDLPDSWVCPLCGVPKNMFEKVEE